MALFRKAYEGKHLEVAEEIVRNIAPLYGENIFPHFYTICLYSGWMPDGVIDAKIDTFDLKNNRWAEVQPARGDVVMFFPGLTAGFLSFKEVLSQAPNCRFLRFT